MIVQNRGILSKTGEKTLKEMMKTTLNQIIREEKFDLKEIQLKFSLKYLNNITKLYLSIKNT